MNRSSFSDPPAVLTKIYRDVSIHRMLNTDLQHDLVLCVFVQRCSVTEDQAGGHGGSASHQPAGHHADLQGSAAQHAAHTGGCHR